MAISSVRISGSAPWIEFKQYFKDSDVFNKFLKIITNILKEMGEEKSETS